VVAQRQLPDPPARDPDRDRCGVRRGGVVLLAVVIVAVFAGSQWLKSRLDQRVPGPKQWVPGPKRSGGPVACRRIVSLAPSVTEILFQLGLGDRVVGVSRFCKYPPEARNRPRVGGLFDPNMEAILALRPDLVIMPRPRDNSAPGFNKLGLATLMVEHRDPENILESIGVIGRACGVEKTASALVDELCARCARVREKTARLPRPRVLISVSRTAGSGRLEGVYAAGNSAYFNPIIDWAGGWNVLGHTAQAYPIVSREAILKTNPEVIVDLVNVSNTPNCSVKACRRDWDQLSQVDAVAEDRVYVLTEDYAPVPGPRFILLVEKLARLLHPEVDWNKTEPRP